MFPLLLAHTCLMKWPFTLLWHTPVFSNRPLHTPTPRLYSTGSYGGPGNAGQWANEDRNNYPLLLQANYGKNNLRAVWISAQIPYTFIKVVWKLTKQNSSFTWFITHEANGCSLLCSYYTSPTSQEWAGINHPMALKCWLTCFAKLNWAYNITHLPA